MVKEKCLERLYKELSLLEQERIKAEKILFYEERTNKIFKLNKTIEILKYVIESYEKSDVQLPIVKFEDEYLSQLAKISEFGNDEINYLYTLIDFYLNSPSAGKPYFSSSYLLTAPNDTLRRFEESKMVDQDSDAILDVDGLKQFIKEEKIIFESEVEKYLSIFNEEDVRDISIAIEETHIASQKNSLRFVNYVSLIKKHQDKLKDIKIIDQIHEAMINLNNIENKLIKGKYYDRELARALTKFVSLQHSALISISVWYLDKCNFHDSLRDSGQYPRWGFRSMDSVLKEFDKTRLLFDEALEHIDNNVEANNNYKEYCKKERIRRYTFLKNLLNSHGVICDDSFLVWFIEHRADISFVDSYAKNRVSDITSKVVSDIMDGQTAMEMGISFEELRESRTGKQLKIKTGV